MATYPSRCKFFAHKFVRLLHKAAVASEIGRDAFALLVVVAHTEDAMRYRGAAKFWNSQLTETLGFKKWDQFDKARKRAIESGWLIYTCHGKRMAGEYWVSIPDSYESITDEPIEPESSPDLGYDRGYKDGYDRGYEEGIKRGTIEGQTGGRSGDEQGEPSIPDPDPDPKTSRRNIFDACDMDLALWIWTTLQEMQPTLKQPNLEAWANDCRLMRTQDNREDNEIRTVFAWANRDEFWRLNIMSPSKLRKQFDRLAIQVREGRNRTQNNGRHLTAAQRAEQANADAFAALQFADDD